MEAIAWHGELKGKLSIVRIRGAMRRRSAAGFWKWLAFLVKKINGLISYFKCNDAAAVVRATLKRRRRARGRPCEPKLLEPSSDLSCEDDDGASTSSTSSSSKARPAPRGRRRRWVKRLAAAKDNGKGANKREMEFEGVPARLARKRRRIWRNSAKQQQQRIFGDLVGLRPFLRPDERCSSSIGGGGGGESATEQSPVGIRTAQNQAQCADGNEEEAKTEDGGFGRGDYEQRADSGENPSGQQLLPDELVDKVLGRLPLTSVLRFRSVCRRWQWRLSPEGWGAIFAQQQQAAIAPPSWRPCPALFTSGNGRRQCAFYDLTLRTWTRISLDFLPDSACRLLAASGGLLCLCYSGMNSSLFVCNPLTRSWRTLPEFHHTRRRAGTMIVHMLVHARTQAYKVILIGHPTCMTAAPPPLTEVFDSETDSWTSLSNVPTDGCTLSPSVILRNGVLYCLTELPTGLLAFNLARKVWRRLEIKSHFRVLYIFEHGGHILLVARMSARVTRLGIWRLRESFPRVWLKVAVMPADHADYFLKGGRLQCFGHGNLICFASCRRPDWLLFDLGKREWSWERPARDLDQDNYNRWFFYEPRLDIRA